MKNISQIPPKPPTASELVEKRVEEAVAIYKKHILPITGSSAFARDQDLTIGIVALADLIMQQQEIINYEKR